MWWTAWFVCFPHSFSCVLFVSSIILLFHRDMSFNQFTSFPGDGLPFGLQSLFVYWYFFVVMRMMFLVLLAILVITQSQQLIIHSSQAFPLCHFCLLLLLFPFSLFLILLFPGIWVITALREFQASLFNVQYSACLCFSLFIFVSSYPFCSSPGILATTPSQLLLDLMYVMIWINCLFLFLWLSSCCLFNPCVVLDTSTTIEFVLFLFHSSSRHIIW